MITPSVANGALILRHELGHSVIPVGEEYDGGFPYRGVNSDTADDLEKQGGVSWAHWLADDHPNAPSHAQHDTALRIERSMMPLQEWAWTLLNTSTPWSARFNSVGTYARYLMRFSISGVPLEGEVRVLFDGEDLGWRPMDGIGMDRWVCLTFLFTTYVLMINTALYRYHYDVYRNTSLAAGEHNVTVVLESKEHEGTAQLCSFEVLEFGDEDE